MTKITKSARNKPKKRSYKCKHCRAEYVKKTTDIRRQWCSPSCGAALALKARKRQQQKERSKVKKEKREFDRQDVRWQHKQCQKVFNKMRVLEELAWFKERGQEPDCISCARKNMDWCCGHLKTVGGHGGLRYDRMNTYLQCNYYCNRNKSGNIYGDRHSRGYLQGLIDRFGDSEANTIIDYCNSTRGITGWDWREMEAWRKSWNQRIRELEKYLQ